jgi:hypothetical protein
MIDTFLVGKKLLAPAYCGLPFKYVSNVSSYRGTTGSQSKYIRDGAAAHFSRAVVLVLRNTYQDRWIGRGGPTAWPPRSTLDSNPPVFYLCVHLTILMYAASVDKCGWLSDYLQLTRNP